MLWIAANQRIQAAVSVSARSRSRAALIWGLVGGVLKTSPARPPEAPVVAWLHRQPAKSVWITSITLFEARFGLALLPSGLGDGKRSRWRLPAC